MILRFFEEAATQLFAAVCLKVQGFIIAAGDVLADVIYRNLAFSAVELAACVVGQVLVLRTFKLFAAVANSVFIKFAA